MRFRTGDLGRVCRNGVRIISVDNKSARWVGIGEIVLITAARSQSGLTDRFEVVWRGMVGHIAAHDLVAVRD